MARNFRIYASWKVGVSCIEKSNSYRSDRFYWKIFGSSEEIKEIEDNCKKGLIGCADCKRKLACKLNQKMAPIREKRKYYENNPDKLKEILIEGSNKARAKAKEVLAKVEEKVMVFR